MKLFQYTVCALTLATSTLASDIILVKKAPDGKTPYDSNWFYADFKIPDHYWVRTIYGGFTRPGYPDSLKIFDAQFNSKGSSFNSLSQNQLWNNDSAGASLYDTALDIAGKVVDGPGTLRISAPTGKSAVWNIVFLVLSPETHFDAARPSPHETEDLYRWHEGIIIPTTELIFGFQAPIFQGGAIHSVLHELYPNDFTNYFSEESNKWLFVELYDKCVSSILGGLEWVFTQISSRRMGTIGLPYPFFPRKFLDVTMLLPALRRSITAKW